MSDGDKGLRAIRQTDPCYYCGRPLPDVAKDGCGSHEFPRETVNRLCEVYARTQNERAK